MMKKKRYTIFLETLGVPPNLFTADFTVCHRYRANVILYLRSVLCWTSALENLSSTADNGKKILWSNFMARTVKP